MVKRKVVLGCAITKVFSAKGNGKGLEHLGRLCRSARTYQQNE